MDPRTIELLLALEQPDPEIPLVQTLREDFPPSVVTYTAWMMVLIEALRSKDVALQEEAQAKLREILPLIPANQLGDRDFYAILMDSWLAPYQDDLYAVRKAAFLSLDPCSFELGSSPIQMNARSATQDLSQKLATEWSYFETTTELTVAFQQFRQTMMAVSLSGWINPQADYVPASLRAHFEPPPKPMELEIISTEVPGYSGK